MGEVGGLQEMRAIYDGLNGIKIARSLHTEVSFRVLKVLEAARTSSD